MRRRLFWAIFGVSGAVLAVALVLSVAAINTARERATRAELERAGEVAEELVAAELEDLDPDRLGRGALRELVEAQLNVVRRAAGGSEVGVFLVTASGEVLGPPPVRGLPIDGEAVLAGEDTFTEIRVDGAEVLVHTRSVGELGELGTTVGVTVVRRVPLQLDLPRGFAVLALVLVAAGAAVAARLLAGTITRRLDAVAGAASQLADGDLSARVAEEGDDELTTVAHAFNQMAESLEETRERERRFLLSVGHDLRTPLTTIAGYAEALEDAPHDPAEVERIAGVLGTESSRLRRLIEDVMALARLEASEFTLRAEEVDVVAHVEETLRPFADRAGAVGVRLDRELDPVGTRRLDPDRLAQVLANLVENALRYTPEGGAVTVHLTGDIDGITLEVADTGPGIEPEDLPHVFDRFYVARRYRGVRSEGSGLGLSIVRTLAEAMGGGAEATSEPGAGTTVTVRVPAPPV